ncbi:MAG: bifunctional phosphoribosyl-AMP cyclohydrolase/phosphoribosyl-ATP diphosphatase HisIE [Methanomassiliicoccaceae archaeon]|nr:bifunctional phosphoribosyl-AMP cyclohydrolase/phosphoribosyl-ATP diphosphatase HisIE [Methanomassiliicoccaceae archaeon]
MRFDENGLITVVVQDSVTSEVLMVAWANEDAVKLMKDTGYTHFWSRSRKRLWKKGEESGHFQKIISMQTDCDSDTLLVRVEQTGVACHTGSATCFNETIFGDTDRTSAVIPVLKRIIQHRKKDPSPDSYTCKLFDDENKMCKKIVEEAGEFVLSVKDGSQEEMAWELADLIYHAMVAIEKTGLPMEKVFEKLSERMK